MYSCIEIIIDQTKDKDQLKILSIEYAKTMKHLERLVTKGKRVLTLMEICGKYESHDKIKAFPVIECKRPEDLPSDDLPLSQRASGCPEWDLSRQVNGSPARKLRAIKSWHLNGLIQNRFWRTLKTLRGSGSESAPSG